MTAAWVFLDAAETGRLKSLLLGALIVGLAFNVKMLQAFLPLPAFYAAYFLFAKKTWSRKFLELGLASIILVVVSLAWVAAVDLVPAQSRPYVGSTRTNSEWELVTGYNGINRLVGQMGGPPGKMDDPDRAAFQPPPPQAGGTNTGSALPAPPPSPSGGGVPGGGPGMGETGERGFLRFFKAPLAKEMSWLPGV